MSDIPVVLVGPELGDHHPHQSLPPTSDIAPPPLLSLTLPPRTQKVSLLAGVSCWGGEAGSAKERFGGVRPQELQSQGAT